MMLMDRQLTPLQAGPSILHMSSLRRLDIQQMAMLSLMRSQVFLWPIALIFQVAPLAVLFGFNPTRFVLGLYFK